MFGGLAFLVNGNMSVSASGRGGLMLRCDPDETEALVAKPHCADGDARPRDGRLAARRAGRESGPNASCSRGSRAASATPAACRRSRPRWSPSPAAGLGL